MILRDMTEADLDAVLAIERAVHEHPWTPGNFSDALRSKYQCKVYESETQEVIGYAVMMLAVDEAELLDIAIASLQQRKGQGKRLLNEMLALARKKEMRRMVLEVRASNRSAIALYRSAGFSDIGLRRDYYQKNGGREDAILMGRGL
ncbi:MAG: ribosomal protein S18-alanine N-acetyltransferase [Gammaproteobacteria bacterium]|nr:ribosomal protein S18-alanine N-acetyltransferase [Gammaproteobacteria bacterium]MBU1625692.1 ribosomal protein S18-alanine N-acetyltransferase [Gammaproteobacteria bacterium]MBU1980952.1 ribosomal protein S18-alanine N-acetyltransferase [Gammaproteobacteria bacterium]